MPTGPGVRVLLLTQSLNAWGAQRQLVELARSLDQRGCDVRIGVLDPIGPLRAELDALGLGVESFARRWRWDLSPVTRLVRYLRRESIDVIHSFLFLPNFYARFAGRFAGTPAVVSSLRSTGIEGWPRYALDVATCFLCDVMIANSEAGRDDYVRHGGLRKRITVIRNGAPKQRGGSASIDGNLRGLSGFSPLLGMVAALEARKDQELLIWAMVEVVARHPRAGLVLAGEGSHEPRLRALVTALGLQSRVVFPGRVDHPDRLYPLLDVYVQASRSGEGISNSILEAMSHDLPVVATDVGGNREVVVDGVTGRLVPAGDVGRLGDALLELLADAERRRTMGRAGAARVASEFGLDAMVDATQAVYERLLGRRAAGC